MFSREVLTLRLVENKHSTDPDPDTPMTALCFLDASKIHRETVDITDNHFLLTLHAEKCYYRLVFFFLFNFFSSLKKSIWYFFQKGVNTSF